MDLRFLNYFTKVYEEKTISGAAKKCFVAQPSISNSIKQLEAELNVTLFQRFPRGVVATPQGDELYPLAKKMLNDALSIKNHFSHQARALPFRLGLSRALGVERMSQLLHQFTAEVANLELTLVEHTQAADARIISNPLLQDDELFEVIWKDRYVLAVPAGHALSTKAQIKLTYLAQLPFVSRVSCEGQAVLLYEMEKLGLRPNVRAKIQTVEYALGLVSAGVGVALIPDIPALLSRNDIFFIPLADINIERNIGLAYKSLTTESTALTKLRQLCRRQ